MNRRHALQFAVSAIAAARAPPVWAQAAAAGLRRVGVLAPSTNAKEELTLKPFFDQMRELGWIDGQNIAYDRAYADDQMAMLPRLAAELVARKPELIFAPPQSAAVAAKQATAAIPIVFATGVDPVGAGLVASLARPGGNVTGVVSVVDSLAPKRVELLREILPGAKRIGLLGDPKDPRLTIYGNALRAMGATLGLTIVVGEASNPAEFDAAVSKVIAQGVDMLYGSGSLATNMRVRLIELGNRRRVPAIGTNLSWVEAGALFNYGASQDDQMRRSAQMIDKVLRGSKPADIPVEQLTTYKLVINVRAAKALGITIPSAVLLRADEVIQ